MKRKTVIAVISLLLVVTLLVFVVPTIAKYKTNKGQQRELTSQNFYFSSNFLKSDEVPVYEIYGNTVTFQVRNYIDSLRINDSKISYTVSTTAGSLKKADGMENYAGEELTLAGGAKNSDSITLTYEFAVGEEQKEITVTAESTGVYKKVLSAKFKLLKPDGIAYEIKDKVGRNYAEMYIYMGNTAQNVILSWDNAKTLIDETNDYVFSHVQNQTSPKKSTVAIGNIAAYTTVKIVFFKNDISENYTHGLTKSDGTITIS